MLTADQLQQHEERIRARLAAVEVTLCDREADVHDLALRLAGGGYLDFQFTAPTERTLLYLCLEKQVLETSLFQIRKLQENDQ